MKGKFYSYLLAGAALMTTLLSTGCNPESKPNPDPVTPPQGEPGITLTVKSTAPTEAVFTALVINSDKIKYTNYLKGQRPEESKIVWKDTVITQNGSFDIKATGLTADAEYTFEAFAAYQAKESAKKTIDYVAKAPIVALTITDLVTAQCNVSFNGAFDKTLCDGFFYMVVPADKYNKDEFLVNCKPTTEGQVINTPASESGVIYYNSGDALVAETDYVLALVGAKFNEHSSWKEFVGDVVEFRVKTQQIKVNIENITLGLKVPDNKITFGGAQAFVSREAGSKIGGFYSGAIKKSDVGAQTIDDAVVAWLNAKHPTAWGGLKNYQMQTPFWAEENEMEVNYQLEANTDYVIFALAYSDRGVFGKVTSKEIKTQSVSFDSPAKVAVTITPNITSAKLVPQFLDGCTRAYINHAPAGEYTAETAKTELLTKFLSTPDLCWTAEATTEVDFGYLESNKEYELYILPVDKDGKFGAISHQTYKTSELSFDGAATVSVELVDVIENLENFNFDHTFELTYGNGAVKCEYITSVGVGDDGKPLTALQMATNLYNNGSTFTSTVETIVCNGYSELEAGYSVVFVPIDASGKRGAPVAVELAVPGGGGGGGVDPLMVRR